MPVPDLLHEVPVLAGPEVPTERRLRECLTFGFARGVERERLIRLSAPRLARSSFSLASFERDLFLDELIESSFSLVVRGRALQGSDGWFKQVLTGPPEKEGDATLRRCIIGELGDLERRRWLENAYLGLVDFREALCGGDHFNQPSVGVRRRIDVLLAFRKALEGLERATMTSQTGLRRVADWVSDFRSSAEYERLTELLSFEDGRSVLETRLQAGYDGTLRHFEIVRVTEVAHKGFPRGSLARFFRSLWALLKGYRFSEEDVMSQVLDQVFVGVESAVVTALTLMQQLEFFLRALHFQDLVQSKGLICCAPQWLKAGEDTGVELEALFNPWLLVSSDTKVVPCKVSMKPGERTVIVTGPNSGGKTRLLQSLAIAQLLAQVGLPVVARSARLRRVDQLFLSLIERADANQDEGRLGLELMRIRSVFESTTRDALILMDELCSGTNPSEGEGIFDLVLELFDELGPQVWITTHFLDFASRVQARAEETKCTTRAFLQVELTRDELPTYQFVRGVAQTSLARNTASRLGVTRDELRELILRRQLSPAK